MSLKLIFTYCKILHFIIQKINIFHLFSKIVELEEELRVVGNNLKSLEVSEEKALQREDAYEEQIRNLSSRLKEVYCRIQMFLFFPFCFFCQNVRKTFFLNFLSKILGKILLIWIITNF